MPQQIHLGTCIITDPEDVRIFDESFEHPVATPTQRAFFRRAIELFARQSQ